MKTFASPAALLPKIYRLCERNLYRKYEKKIATSADPFTSDLAGFAVMYDHQFHLLRHPPAHADTCPTGKL